MYRKDMLRNWSSPHLLLCGWYFDCSKENNFPSKFEIRKKYEPTFLHNLGALEKETLTKKRMDRGRRKGKK
jgi:hypothetical protein